jgi:hypothetical protein
MRKILLTAICAAVFSAASAQWTTDLTENTRLTADNHLAPQVAQAPDGTVYLAIPRMEPTGVSYYLQIVRPDGTTVFPADDYMLVSNEPFTSFTMNNQMLLVDADGNAIVTVSDYRNELNKYSQTAYKFSPEGERLWKTPVDLNEGYATSIQASLSKTQLTSGDYVFAYYYGDNTVGGLSFIKLIYVSNSGEIKWTKTLGDASTPYNYPYLVPAQYGQFILVFAKTASQQLYARKYDIDGETAWSADAAIYLGGFIGGRVHTALHVISDEDGGVFAAWYDDRYSSNYEKTYVSHITKTGEQGFAGVTDGLRISFGFNGDFRAFAPLIAYDNAGKFLYVIYPESNVGQQLRRYMIQKINRDGELLWESSHPEEGEETRIGYVAASNFIPHETTGTQLFSSIENNSIRVLPGNRIMVGYTEERAPSGETRPYAKVFNVGGIEPVLDTTVLISTQEASLKTSLYIFPLPEEDTYVGLWRDYRSASLSNANAGEFGQKFSIARSQTAIKTVITDAPIVAREYYDVLGKRLRAKPTQGFVIEKVIKSDNTFEVNKIFIRNN